MFDLKETGSVSLVFIFEFISYPILCPTSFGPSLGRTAERTHMDCTPTSLTSLKICAALTL